MMRALGRHTGLSLQCRPLPLALGAQARHGEILKVRFEVVLGGEGLPELLHIRWVQIEGVLTGGADQVMVLAVGIRHLIVEAVADAHLSNQAQLLQQVDRAVHRGDVDIRVRLLNLMEDLIHAQVSFSISDGGQDE